MFYSNKKFWVRVHLGYWKENKFENSDANKRNYKATLGTVDTLMYDIATLEQDAPDPATVDAVNDDVYENLDVVTVDDKESDDSDDDESESDDE